MPHQYQANIKNCAQNYYYFMFPCFRNKQVTMVTGKGIRDVTLTMSKVIEVHCIKSWNEGGHTLKSGHLYIHLQGVFGSVMDTHDIYRDRVHTDGYVHWKLGKTSAVFRIDIYEYNIAVSNIESKYLAVQSRCTGYTKGCC